MGWPADIEWALFVFEDVRLALEGQAEALYARGEDSDYDSKLEGRRERQHIALER